VIPAEPELKVVPMDNEAVVGLNVSAFVLILQAVGVVILQPVEVYSHSPAIFLFNT